MSRSRVLGAARVRSLFGRIEPAMRAELAKEMESAGRDLLAEMQRIAPVRTGAFERALSYKFLPNSLKLKVGLVGKAINRDIFYAHILEFGRKAKTVSVTRGGKRPSTYLLHVSPLAPHRTVFARFTDLRTTFNRRLKGIWARALQQAAAGAFGND